MLKKDHSNKFKIFVSLFEFILLFLVICEFCFPIQAWSINNQDGKSLFTNYCSGCHINGGNIIRRNKTLKLSDLKRNGLDNPDAIAEIARNGIGIMNGYEKFLGEGGDKIVANWIWEEAQKT